MAYMCLHDMDRMPRAVAEASRVLAPAGRLCASIPLFLHLRTVKPG